MGQEIDNGNYKRLVQIFGIGCIKMKVKCEICNKEFNQIAGSHLMSVHNLSKQDYINLYPNAQVTSEETKEKISKNHADISGEKNPFYGKHHTQESIERGNILRRKYRHSDKVKKRMSESHKGKKHTDEEKKKIGNAHKGKYVSIETRMKLSRSKTGKPNHKLRGRPRSEITKKRVSESLKGRFSGENNPFYGKKHTEESKRKISESEKGKIIPDDLKKRWSEQRKGLLCGDKNPAWKGGISFEPYCQKFNETLKESIRRRDNYTCQNPDCNEVQNGRKHSIHHVHYDKENCYPDLITLCNSCNSKANANRDYWEQFYMDILEKRGLLYYEK